VQTTRSWRLQAIASLTQYRAPCPWVLQLHAVGSMCSVISGLMFSGCCQSAAAAVAAARCCAGPTQMSTTRLPGVHLTSGRGVGAHMASTGCGGMTSCPAGDCHASCGHMSCKQQPNACLPGASMCDKLYVIMPAAPSFGNASSILCLACLTHPADCCCHPYCRVYLRHCVLAAKGFCPEAYDSFLDATYLSDRVTTVRQHLEAHPEILQELPPPELIGRYSG
jgi:hypothetical protein